jgi:hypothetical protein
MESTLFPSGDWVGYYNYDAGGSRYLMDIRFTFTDGRINAAGCDDIGEFVLTGTYDENTRECHWVKHYIGKHDVTYTGFREGKGIWGTWSLVGGKGGFHVWPLSSGGLGESVETDTGVEVPVSTLPALTVPERETVIREIGELPGSKPTPG